VFQGVGAEKWAGSEDGCLPAAPGSPAGQPGWGVVQVKLLI